MTFRVPFRDTKTCFDILLAVWDIVEISSETLEEADKALPRETDREARDVFKSGFAT